MPTPYEIVAAHYAASARQDLAAMLADLSPEVRWVEMAGFPCAGTWIGPTQVIENVFAALGRDWDGFRFELERLVDGDSTIVALGHYCGTYRKTGRSMKARTAHVWQVTDGKLSGFEQFTDTLLVARAMRERT